MRETGRSSAARKGALRLKLWPLVGAAVLTAIPSPALALPSATPQPTAGANDQVWAIAQSGNMIYIGGQFTQVGGVTRNRLAAIDAVSGDVLPWDPNSAGVVCALAIGADGYVYAGGKFTSVGGVTRKNVVKLHPTTGAVVTAWRGKATQGVVRALAATSSDIYLGGTFLKVNATPRNRLAALDSTTGALRSWNPGANDVVRGLDVGADGSVYAGGYFTIAGGVSRRGVVRLNPVTGAATAFNAGIGYPLTALSVVGSRVYLAGAGLGGTVAAHDAVTGARVWSVATDGDVQGIDASGSTVYAGGHFDIIGGAPRWHLAALDATDGTLLAWEPRPNGPYGVGPVVVTSDALLIGGGFTKVNGIDQPKFARLPGAP
jgi:hypothetical protein